MLPYESGIPLQEWANTHEPDDKMLFKRGYWDQIIFVRDWVHRLFYREYEQAKLHPVRVVATHRSKSIVLPVYSVKVPGFEIRMRYNFYDWKLSIKSDLPVPDAFLHIINKSQGLSPVYFEGFEKDWVFGSYDMDPCKFSVEIGHEYFVFAFLHAVVDAMNLKQ